jgi:restriction system protein
MEGLDRAIVQAMRLEPDVAKLPHHPERPDRTEVSYRIAWARTYLKQAGLIDNPHRGNCAVTARQ